MRNPTIDLLESQRSEFALHAQADPAKLGLRGGFSLEQVRTIRLRTGRGHEKTAPVSGGRRRCQPCWEKA